MLLISHRYPATPSPANTRSCSPAPPPAPLAALAFVIFIIVPGCTPGRAGSGGIPGCEMNLPVVYLCSFLFLAAAV